MIHCLIRYLSGYVKIQIKGYSPERFLNLCCYHRIRFWGLTRIGTNYELYLSLSDFRKIRPYVRKTHTKVILKKTVWLSFFSLSLPKKKTILYQHLPMHFSNRLLLAISMGYSFSGK